LQRRSREILKEGIRSAIMSTNVIRNWKKKKKRLRLKYPVITAKDLLFPEGKETKMIEMLGEKLGISRQELLNIIVSI
jgi:hypothetical protein